MIRMSISKEQDDEADAGESQFEMRCDCTAS